MVSRGKLSFQCTETSADFFTDYGFSKSFSSFPPLHRCFPSFCGLCSFTTGGRKIACHCIRQSCAVCFRKKMVYFRSRTVCLVWSVRHLRHYLACHPFTIITDHKPLVGLKKLHLHHDPTGRRARWAIELDLYDWHAIHRDGAKHLNADAMSRRPDTNPVESESCSQGNASTVSVAT